MKQIMCLEEDGRSLKVHKGYVEGQEHIVFHYVDSATQDDLTVSCALKRRQNDFYNVFETGEER